MGGRTVQLVINMKRRSIASQTVNKHLVRTQQTFQAHSNVLTKKPSTEKLSLTCSNWRILSAGPRIHTI